MAIRSGRGTAIAHVNYTAYDLGTGGVIETITDVNYASLTTDQQTSFNQTGWSHSSGLKNPGKRDPGKRDGDRF